MPQAFVANIDDHRTETAVEPAEKLIQVPVVRPEGRNKIPAFNHDAYDSDKQIARTGSRRLSADDLLSLREIVVDHHKEADAGLMQFCLQHRQP